MLDGTPVLDVKPYIPHYDNPVTLSQQWNAEKHLGNDIYGSNSELIDHSRIPREAPDGEEEGSSNDVSSAMSSMQISEQVCLIFITSKTKVKNGSNFHHCRSEYRDGFLNLQQVSLV